MNLTDQVIALITAYGSADVDRLMPHLTCTRTQAMRALENASRAGYLKAIEAKGFRAGLGGRRPATYSVGKKVKPVIQALMPAPTTLEQAWNQRLPV